MDSSTLLNNRYRIRRELGRGGFGAVYLAGDARLPGRLVALKENLVATREARAQFEREALLLARLRHPNLPQVTDYFSDAAGRQYLVMDYVEGDNLRQLLAQRGGPLPVEEALAITQQVMRALAYMHAWVDPQNGQPRPVIHRDVKPDNIKRTPDGRIVLVDFGIAKIQSDTATVNSARALTPGYAPIEQYHGGTDERSDIYSLAATLYALLTGRAPPSATSMAAGAPLPPPRSLNQDIPTRCAKVIEKALSLKAADRYQTVAEMYQALYDRPLPGQRAAAGAPGRGQPRRVRSFWAWGGLAAGLIALTFFIVLWQMRGGPVAPETGGAGAGETPAPVAAQVATVTPTLAPATATPPAGETAGGDGGLVAAPTDEADATPSAPTVATLPTRESETTATPTASETPTDAPPEGSALSTPPTSTRVPTVTPISTATATNTPLPTPTATRAQVAPTLPPAALTDREEGGPRSVTILAPENGRTSNAPVEFRWQADAPLLPGQRFDVVFWNGAGQTQDDGRAWINSTTGNFLVINPRDQIPGDYRWGIWLIEVDPYRRVRYLGSDGGYAFSVPGDTRTDTEDTSPAPTPSGEKSEPEK